MSVPVVPEFDTPDTASAVPTPLTTRTDKPLSDLPVARRGALREYYFSEADMIAAGITPPDRDAPRVPYRSGGQTYVVRRQGWIKIGRSRDLTTRLVALRAPQPGVICPDGMDLSAPLQLICTFAHNIEIDLHKRYAVHRAAGEWFVADATMLAEIAAMPEGKAA